MPDDRNPKSLMMMIAIAVIFIIAAGVTIYAALAFVHSPDRGFIFWTATGFILFIETVAAAFAMGMLSGRKTSTPVITASWIVVILLAVVGLASITVYHFIRDPVNHADRAFAAVLAIEVALAIIIVLILRAWDAYFQAAAAPIAAARQEHATRGRSLQALIIRLRGLSWTDHQQALRADRLLKRLEAARLALAHSHGGGAGSREAGKPQAINPADNEQIQKLLAELDAEVTAMEQRQEVPAQLDQAETTANRLQAQIAAMQLD